MICSSHKANFVWFINITFSDPSNAGKRWSNRHVLLGIFQSHRYVKRDNRNVNVNDRTTLRLSSDAECNDVNTHYICLGCPDTSANSSLFAPGSFQYRLLIFCTARYSWRCRMLQFHKTLPRELHCPTGPCDLGRCMKIPTIHVQFLLVI